MTVAIIDGMAELQSLGKPHWVSSCEKLAKHFNDCLFHKYHESDEVRLVFDRYDLPSSLKTATSIIHCTTASLTRLKWPKST